MDMFTFTMTISLIIALSFWLGFIQNQERNG